MFTLGRTETRIVVISQENKHDTIKRGGWNFGVHVETRNDVKSILKVGSSLQTGPLVSLAFSPNFKKKF